MVPYKNVHSNLKIIILVSFVAQLRYKITWNYFDAITYNLGIKKLPYPYIKQIKSILATNVSISNFKTNQKILAITLNKNRKKLRSIVLFKFWWQTDGKINKKIWKVFKISKPGSNGKTNILNSLIFKWTCKTRIELKKDKYFDWVYKILF